MENIKRRKRSLKAAYGTDHIDFSKLLCILLCTVMLSSIFGRPALAVENEGYVSGVTITPPTEEDLNGEYGEAYAAAGYKVTFVYEDTEGTADRVYIYGTLAFYNSEEIVTYSAKDDPTYDGPDGADMSTIDKMANIYTAYEYREGYFTTGYDVVSTEQNFLPEDVERYIRPFDGTDHVERYGSIILYRLDEVEDGIYTLSMPLPASEYLYSYWIFDTEGGMSWERDPANQPESNPATGANPGWSYIFVGDASDALPGQEYIYPRTDGKTGTVEYREYEAVDGSTQALAVYLPYGYDDSKEYKTVYLIHGGGGNETEWIQIGAAANIMDNLIADGLTEEAVVVCLSCMDIWSINRVMIEDPEDKRNDVEIIDYAVGLDNLKECVVPFIEEQYAVSAEASDRAVAGLSQGGRNAINFLIEDPTYFGYVGGFSGAECGIPVEDWDIEGMKDTVIYTAAGNVDYGLGYYGQDPATDKRKAYTIAEFNQMMEEQGIAYATDIFWGGHDWSVWRAAFTVFAKDVLWSADDGAAVSAIPGETLEDITEIPAAAPTETTEAHENTTEAVETGSTQSGNTAIIVVIIILAAVIAIVIVSKKKKA